MDQTNCVLMLDLPPSSLAGIDLISFTTTQRFQGVKNLPPGWHFVFASSTTSQSVRHGAWLHISDSAGPPQLFIKRWDPNTEDLDTVNSETDILRWRANLGSIWKHGLMPYRQSTDTSKDGEGVEDKSDWVALTSYLTSALLSRITGDSKDQWSLTSASTFSQDMDDLGVLAESSKYAEKELHFLPVDLKRTWRKGATGRERTEAARDRSWALGDLIDHHCAEDDSQAKEKEILGEIQFTFLMVLTLNNNSCLEQWKRLLSLLFTCRRAVQERTWFFLELLKLLKLQLSHCRVSDGDLFDLAVDGGGLLVHLLRKFRRGLDDFDGKWKADVVDEFDELQDYLRQEYGWDVDDAILKRGLVQLEDGECVDLDVLGADEDEEAGEYAPTVVDLTPEQLRELGGADIHMEEEEEAGDIDAMDMRF